MQSPIWNDERITAYALGELSASERASLEAEMKVNPELAQAVAEAKAIADQLSTMFADEPTMMLSDHQRDRILASSVPAVTAASGKLTSAATFRWLPRFALAACVMLIGSLGLLLFQLNQPLQVATAVRVDGPAGAPQAATELPPLLAASERPNGPVLQNDEPEAERYAKEVPADQVDYVANEPAKKQMTELQEQMSLPVDAEAKLAEADGLLGGSLSKEQVQSAPQPAAPATQLSDKLDRSLPLRRFYEENGMAGGMRSGAASSVLLEESGGSQSASLDAKVSIDDVASTYALLPRREALNFEPAGSALAAAGRGPGQAGDQFEPIIENEFRRVSEQPLSTFSIDVDTASYAKVRQFLLQVGSLPPAGAVRIEEMVNYFDYEYSPPAAESEHPFVANVEVADCPWKPEHRLARIALKGKVVENQSRPSGNLVFLIDTSGSMNQSNKLPLVKQGLEKLLGQLNDRDRVAIVVYAGSAGLVLDSTPASDRATILRRLNQLQAGGSTNGGEGIRLAYQVARDHFLKDGVNRVILCSDGDFNVGVSSDDELVRLVETEAKGGIDLTVLGFGMGNHNDAMMEKISGRGNGNYAFVDSLAEAQRVLVQQVSSTLVTIARDVKIQVEFNPAEVAAYRLIGYENRKLNNEDFKDDTKDAGEIGAGHAVTALYEWIPAQGDTSPLAPQVDPLRYQTPNQQTDASKSGELMTVKLRYKKPESTTSTPLEFPVSGAVKAFAQTSADFRFASSVAAFGMLLRSSQYAGNWSYQDVEQAAKDATGKDQHGLRAEFITLVQRAAAMVGNER